MSQAERRRFCGSCRKPLWLSREGFRCLGCPKVYCRHCAQLHFSDNHKLFMNAMARRALGGLKTFTIVLNGKEHDWVPKPSYVRQMRNQQKRSISSRKSKDRRENRG